MKSGLVPNEDAPDIVANTFLEEVTEDQLDKIGLGFLQHREHKAPCLSCNQFQFYVRALRSVNGHQWSSCLDMSKHERQLWRRFLGTQAF